MTNGEKVVDLVIEKKRIEIDLGDVQTAFRERVNALRNEAGPGEKSVAQLVFELKKRMASVEDEIQRCAAQPNQIVMEL